MDAHSKNTVGLYAAFKRGYTVNKKGLLFNPKGKQVTGSKCQKGYLRTGLGNGKNFLPLYIHQFVAFCKFGAKIFQVECVRHLDGNPLNNAWTNIALGSKLDNSLDRPQDVRLAHATFASLSTIKHDHTAIINLRKEGKTYKEIKAITGITSNGTLHHIFNKGLTFDEELTQSLTKRG